MSIKEFDEISVLKITLHGRLVGYLAGYQNGRNVLSFADDFKNDADRPTFSLITHPIFPRAKKLMTEPWVRNLRIHPTLSNLLPEGSMRELITQNLKLHIDHEFHILSYLGKNKDWYKASYEHFEAWAKHSNIPWRSIKPHLDDVMEKARSQWPNAINDQPMNENHKKKLQRHWKKLHEDFRIKHFN